MNHIPQPQDKRVPHDQYHMYTQGYQSGYVQNDLVHHGVPFNPQNLAMTNPPATGLVNSRTGYPVAAPVYVPATSPQPPPPPQVVMSPFSPPPSVMSLPIYQHIAPPQPPMRTMPHVPHSSSNTPQSPGLMRTTPVSVAVSAPACTSLLAARVPLFKPPPQLPQLSPLTKDTTSTPVRSRAIPIVPPTAAPTSRTSDVNMNSITSKHPFTVASTTQNSVTPLQKDLTSRSGQTQSAFQSSVTTISSTTNVVASTCQTVTVSSLSVGDVTLAKNNVASVRSSDSAAVAPLIKSSSDSAVQITRALTTTFSSKAAVATNRKMFQAPTLRSSASGRVSPASPTKAEQEELYMRFADALKAGPVEATDGKILEVFISLSTFERKLVLGSGSIKGFLDKCDMIDVSGNMLSLNEDRYSAKVLEMLAIREAPKSEADVVESLGEPISEEGPQDSKLEQEVATQETTPAQTETTSVITENPPSLAENNNLSKMDKLTSAPPDKTNVSLLEKANLAYLEASRTLQQFCERNRVDSSTAELLDKSKNTVAAPSDEATVTSVATTGEELGSLEELYASVETLETKLEDPSSTLSDLKIKMENCSMSLENLETEMKDPSASIGNLGNKTEESSTSLGHHEIKMEDPSTPLEHHEIKMEGPSTSLEHHEIKMEDPSTALEDSEIKIEDLFPSLGSLEPKKNRRDSAEDLENIYDSSYDSEEELESGEKLDSVEVTKELLGDSIAEEKQETSLVSPPEDLVDDPATTGVVEETCFEVDNEVSLVTKCETDASSVLDIDASEVQPDSDVLPAAATSCMEQENEGTCSVDEPAEAKTVINLEEEITASCPGPVDASQSCTAEFEAALQGSKKKGLDASAPEFSPQTVAQSSITPSSSMDSLSEHLRSLSLNAQAQEFSPRTPVSDLLIPEPSIPTEQPVSLNVKAPEFSPKILIQYPELSCPEGSPLLCDTTIECSRETFTPPASTSSPVYGAWKPLTWSRAWVNPSLPPPPPPPITRLSNQPQDYQKARMFEPPYQPGHNKVLNISIKTPPRKPPKFGHQNTQTENVNSSTVSTQTKVKAFRHLDVQTDSCDAREVAINTLQTMGDSCDPVVPEHWDDSWQGSQRADCIDSATNTKRDIACVDISGLDIIEDKFLLKYRESAHLIAVIFGKKKLSALMGMPEDSKHWPSDLPYLSEDQKKTVQQECADLKASVSSLKDLLDNLTKKITQVEEAAKKKTKSKKKSGRHAVKPVVAPDRSVTRWQFEDFLENLLSVAVIEEVGCKFKKMLEKRNQPEEDVDDEPEFEIPLPFLRRHKDSIGSVTSVASQTNGVVLDEPLLHSHLNRTASEDTSSLLSSGRTQSTGSSADLENTDAEPENRQIRDRVLDSEDKASLDNKVDAMDDSFAKSLAEMPIENLLQLTFKDREGYEKAQDSTWSSVDEPTAVVPPEDAPTSEEVQEPSSAPKARGVGAGLLEMADSTPNLTPSSVPPSASQSAQHALQQQASVSPLGVTQPLVPTGLTGATEQNPLLQQMMLTLIQFNPTLAANPVLLQMTAMQHLLTMQQLQQSMTSANQMQHNLLLQSMMGSNQGNQNPSANQNPLLQSMMGCGALGNQNQTANQMSQSLLLQATMGGSTLGSNLGNQKPSSNQTQQNPLLRASKPQATASSSVESSSAQGSSTAVSSVEMAVDSSGDLTSRSSDSPRLACSTAGNDARTDSVGSRSTPPGMTNILGGPLVNSPSVQRSSSGISHQPRATPKLAPLAIQSVTRTNIAKARALSESDAGEDSLSSVPKPAPERTSIPVVLPQRRKLSSAWNSPSSSGRSSPKNEGPSDSSKKDAFSSGDFSAGTKRAVDAQQTPVSRTGPDLGHNSGSTYERFIPPRLRNRAVSGGPQVHETKNEDIKRQRFYVPPPQREAGSTGLLNRSTRPRTTSEGEGLKQANAAPQPPMNTDANHTSGGRKTPEGKNLFHLASSSSSPKETSWNVAMNKKQRQKQKRVGSGRFSVEDIPWSSAPGLLGKYPGSSFSPNMEVKTEFNFSAWPKLGESKTTPGGVEEEAGENWEDEVDLYAKAFQWKQPDSSFKLPQADKSVWKSGQGLAHHDTTGTRGLDTLDKF